MHNWPITSIIMNTIGVQLISGSETISLGVTCKVDDFKVCTSRVCEIMVMWPFVLNCICRGFTHVNSMTILNAGK